MARWARYYLPVCQKFFSVTKRLSDWERTITTVISESNLFLLDSIRTLMIKFQSGSDTPDFVAGKKREVTGRHSAFRDELNRVIADIEETTGASAVWRTWTAGS